MALDVVDLKQFYASPLGQIATASILRSVRARWQNLQGMAVLGLGYGVPYLDDLREGAERALSFMPGQQGVVHWPAHGLSAASLVNSFELPLRDSVIDRLLLVHALETSVDPLSLLEELWRVLTPGGRMIVIAPRRSGAWSRRDSTPFGHGQPFSRRQLTDLLRQSLFTPVHWGEALYVPPVQSGLILKSAPVWESLGTSLNLPFAGVHVIEAMKQVYRPALVRRSNRESSRLPALVPSVSTGRVLPRQETQAPLSSVGPSS